MGEKPTMLRALLLWAQLILGMVVFFDNGYSLKLSKFRRPLAWLGLGAGVAIIGLAAAEIFVAEYGLAPAELVFPILVALDLLAGWIYLRRPRAGFFENLEAAEKLEEGA
jgi:hypothetical protein